jgi:osmotically-inducible protein OsmY
MNSIEPAMTTDRQLQQAVQDELAWDPSVHADDMDVRVRHGVVTLTGDVQTLYEKWRLDEIVRRVHGVTGLHNEAQVNLDDADKRDDADLVMAVQNILEWTATLSTESITFRVMNGWVSLSGAVKWQFQRVAVKNSVRNLRGVRGVSDEIAVGEPVVQSAVSADIEAALRRGAAADALNIHVAVHAAQVTLTGTVNSWFEHIAATRAAWNSPGVTDVVDRLIMVD